MFLTTTTETALSATNYQTALSNRKDFKGDDDRMESSLLKEQNEQSEKHMCVENNN